MEKVTISQLKNRLSAYLKKVRAGGTILILDRDQPVATIERIQSGGRPSDRLARLEKAGLVRRARSRLPLADLRAEAPISRKSVLEALLEDRREDR